MNISVLNKTVEMVRRIFDPRKVTEPMREHNSDKPYADTSSVLQPFERVSPESVGVPSERVEAFLKSLNNDKSLNMHRVMILRDGKMISDTLFGLQDPSVWKMTFSAAKTVTALAIGLLCDEGLLSVDDKVVKFFDKKLAPLSKITIKDLTVEDLLSMRSGLVFNEAGSLVESDWQKGFLNSVVSGKIGENFRYNSLNSYILSSIVTEITGKSLSDFLRSTLFGELGIENFYWETCPMGIEKGGWGLYIHPEDMAKLGQLVMDKGVWKGKRLLSEEWITAMTSAHAVTPEYCGDHNYGYHIWVGKETNTFLFNGMFGQNVFGFWDNGTVIVSNAGNEEVFQSSSYYRIAEEFFNVKLGGPLPENAEALESLRKTEAAMALALPMNRDKKLFSFFRKRNRAEGWRTTLSKVVLAPVEPCPSVGFLPATLQISQNNFTKGISRLSFADTEEGFFIVFTEGGEDIRLPVDFDHLQMYDLVFDGEPFSISSFGRFGLDEDGNEVLTVDLAFVETPFSRRIKVRFLRRFDFSRAILEIDEQPGDDCLTLFAQRYMDSLDDVPVLGNIVAKADMDFFEFMVRRIIEPVVDMVKVDTVPLPEVKERKFPS